MRVLTFMFLCFLTGCQTTQKLPVPELEPLPAIDDLISANMVICIQDEPTVAGFGSKRCRAYYIRAEVMAFIIMRERILEDNSRQCLDIIEQNNKHAK